METLLDFMVEAQAKKQMTSPSSRGRCIQVLPWKRFVLIGIRTICFMLQIISDCNEEKRIILIRDL